MKKLLSLFLALVLLFGCFAFSEHPECWTQVFNEGIEALHDPETYEYALKCFRDPSIWSAASNYRMYTETLISLIGETEVNRARLIQAQIKMRLLKDDSKFNAVLEENELPTAEQLAQYVEGRLCELTDDIAGALMYYKELEVLDSAERYALLSDPNRPTATPKPTPTPFVRPTPKPLPNYFYIENHMDMSITELYLHSDGSKSLGKCRNAAWIGINETSKITVSENEMTSGDSYTLHINAYWKYGYKSVSFEGYHMWELLGSTIVLTQEGNTVTLTIK